MIRTMKNLVITVSPDSSIELLNMVFTQKYTIISPLESIVEDQVFKSSNWPLHVTLADTFALPLLDNTIISQLGSVTEGRNIKITGLETARFGKHREVEVMLLQPSEELVESHTNIIDILLANGATFSDPQYTKSGFIGHVTQQKDSSLKENETRDLTSIAIIDMFPNKDPNLRKVMKIINFKKD